MAVEGFHDNVIGLDDCRVRAKWLRGEEKGKNYVIVTYVEIAI